MNDVYFIFDNELQNFNICLGQKYIGVKKYIEESTDLFPN